VTADGGMWHRRWWIYQRERFPVFQNGALIAVFTFSAASYSAICRGTRDPVPWQVLVCGIATSFILFLLLRFFDEFKDAEDDARFRPYLPVPRGLITLREVGRGIVIACAIAFAANALVAPAMLPALLLALLYILIMWREFFVARWLRRHAVAYLITHMMVMPVIDFYTTGLDWMVRGVKMPSGLLLFLVVTFLNGCVIEIGRKIRRPQDEEPGVETYSYLWGPRRALAVWLALLAGTGALAYVCCRRGGYAAEALPVLCLLLAGCALPAILFAVKGHSGKGIEVAAGVWTIGMYLTIGGLPMLLGWGVE